MFLMVKKLIRVLGLFTLGFTLTVATEETCGDLDFEYDKIKGGYPRKTDMYMGYMPSFKGFVEYADIYRFFAIQEQVLTMIGEAKHGLWRTQENGLVRLRLKKKNNGEGYKGGVKVGKNLNKPNSLRKLKKNYAYYLEKSDPPNEKSDGPYDEGYSPGKPGEDATFVDIPISHKYFKNRYKDHVPIDLPLFSCGIDGYPGYPTVKELWDYAIQQPNSNKVGPLGKRAGLDIKENYDSVLRLELFPDAKIWVNIGGGGNKDVFDQSDIDEGNMDMDVVYRPLDTSKTNHEVYLFARRTKNELNLHVGVVIDNEEDDQLSYVRPDGAYWDTLPKKDQNKIKKVVTYDPVVSIIDEGQSQKKKMHYLPIAGLHHAYGGFCPQKGGFWGDYPNNPSGAGWYNNYQEITPICDAIVMDLKAYANLDQPSWSNSNFQLQNAGTLEMKQYYLGKGNHYGQYTDPYLLSNGFKNPHALKFTEKSNPSSYLPWKKITINFEEIGKTNQYVDKCGKKLPETGLTVIQDKIRKNWSTSYENWHRYY